MQNWKVCLCFNVGNDFRYNQYPQNILPSFAKWVVSGNLQSRGTSIILLDGATRIYLVGTSSVDARHQRCGFTSLLRPAIPRHPASPVGLLASAPDLVPGHEALPASLRKRFATTWISWGRGIDVNR